MKAAREKEQDIARETIDNLKIKQQREKAQEMDVSITVESTFMYAYIYLH